MRKYPYAIFDMDGTLVDSMPYWQNVGQDYLILQGCEPEENLWQILATMSTEESARYFQERYGLKEDAATIVHGFNEIMRENYRTRIPAKPGVAEYLRKLQDEGVVMGICSATSPDLVEMALTRLGLRSYFTYLTSCDEVDAGKDRPDVFELALRKMGAKPEETVMYEDAYFAVKTAKEVGLHVIGIYDASCSGTPEEMRAMCDTYIKEFTELL